MGQFPNDYTPVTATGVDADDKFLLDVDSATQYITLAELRKAMAPEIAFTQSIPFDAPVTKLAATSVTGALTFTANTTGAKAGFGAILRLTANGTNTPDFSAFEELSNSDGWVNTNGTVNQCIFLYNGTEYIVIISQITVVALTQLNAPTGLAMADPGETTGTLSFTDTNSSPNESGYEFYVYDNVGLTLPLVGTFNAAANATTVNITGLTANTQYWVRGIAEGDGVTTSNSALSTTFDFTTDAAGGNEAEFDTWYTAVTGAGGSLSAPFQTAYNDFVAELKTAGIFSTHFDFLQVLCGGSEAACKFNLVDPVDADANYRLTFVNAPTYGATGVTLNGTDEYINTHWIGGTAAKAAINDYHVAVYNRTTAGVAGFTYGVVDSLSTMYGLTRAADDSSYIKQVNSAETSFADATSGKGFYLSQTRAAAPQVSTHKDGVQKIGIVNNGNGLDLSSTYKLFFGARNNEGAADQHTAREFSIISGGKAFDDTQRAAYETAVANLVTALGL